MPAGFGVWYEVTEYEEGSKEGIDCGILRCCVQGEEKLELLYCFSAGDETGYWIWMKREKEGLQEVYLVFWQIEKSVRLSW